MGASGERLAARAYACAVENGYEKYDRFPVLKAAWPQVAAALPLLLAGDDRRLQTVCDALRRFLDFSGRWDDWLSLSTEAEARAEHAKDFTNAGLRAYHAGWCHDLRGQSAEVLACAERAASHWQVARAGASERAIVLRLRGMAYKRAKDYTAAITAFREALDLDRSVAPKDHAVAVGLNALAVVLHELEGNAWGSNHDSEVGASAYARLADGWQALSEKLSRLDLADESQWGEPIEDVESYLKDALSV